eukprot:TRINITY_DN1387_c0_g3_i1.p1 TRINITY_DN1387_c0_g3~~TRINITY_DN1387_c0_g3_i1.p1  ORF type:complete len:468 (+),score=125.64 TRINITY_DN1387_c0_g3_i1:109-1512(+)
MRFKVPPDALPANPNPPNQAAAEIQVTPPVGPALRSPASSRQGGGGGQLLGAGDSLAVSRSQTQNLTRQLSGHGGSPSPREERRCSYGGDASELSRARMFTQQRTRSIAAAKRSELTERMENSVHSWASGRRSPKGKSGKEQGEHQAEHELLTAEQVKTYHQLLEGLQHIRGLHDCVDHPCGNIYWDFRTKRCLPGRVWQDKMPTLVRELVDRDFTDEEVRQIEEAIHLKTAPSTSDEVEPRALFVIGPAAAGKSAVRLKTEDMLQISLSDYVEIDGDEFREKHQGWMQVLKGDRTTGYKDALNVLLPYTRKLKKRVLAEAIAARKNILLPSTASNFEKLMKEVEQVREHNYRIDVVGLVVSYREARARGLNRAHENGRWNDGTMEKWEAAMRAICHFTEPDHSDWCIVFDNQDFTNPTTIFSRTHSRLFVQNVIDQYRQEDDGFAAMVQTKKDQDKAKHEQRNRKD